MSDDVIESIEIFNPENRVLFDVTVEIPKGTKNKYEMDHLTGRIRLARTLFTSTPYPYDSGFIEGTIGADILRHFHVDVAFVSANGFSAKEGLTDFNIYEVELKRRMLENCNHIIAMIDSSKFDRVSSSSFLAAADIDVLLTDDKLPAEMVERCRKHGVNVRVCTRKQDA